MSKKIQNRLTFLAENIQKHSIEFLDMKTKCDHYKRDAYPNVNHCRFNVFDAAECDPRLCPLGRQ